LISNRSGISKRSGSWRNLNLASPEINEKIPPMKKIISEPEKIDDIFHSPNLRKEVIGEQEDNLIEIGSNLSSVSLLELENELVVLKEIQLKKS
jgi:hypothetical protein